MSEAAIDQLIARAKEASEKSYSPYSGFAVGCAILTSDGEIFSGTNVENVSFGLTICAERSAVFNAVGSVGSDLKIQKVVIYTPTDHPITPCGACRQVLSEFGEDFEVLSVCRSDQRSNYSIKELLPKNPDIRLENGK